MLGHAFQSMLYNTRDAWGSVSRNVHWLMVLLFAGQITLGKYAHGLNLSPQKLDLLMWHKSIGITLLLLASFRLIWRIAGTRPETPPGTPDWEHKAAALSHTLLYMFMLAIPVTGWLMNSAKNIPFKLFLLVPWPDLVSPSEPWGKVFEEWHESLVAAFIVLILLHVAAALRHHFIKRDQVLNRMLGRGPSQ